MDTYFKIIGLAMVGVLLSIVISKSSKDYSTVLVLVVCGGIVVGIAAFLRPVLNLIERLTDTIGEHGKWLSTLLKAVGISFVGEVCSSICSDSGQGTIAKMLQYATAVTILWTCIPMIESLLDLVQSILEII